MRTLIIVALWTVAAIAQDVSRGIELYNSGKYAEAERVLREATSAQADNAQAHAYLGMTLLRRGNADGAETSVRRAEELAPDSPDVSLSRGMLKAARRDYQGAVDDLEAAIQAKPDEAYAHYYAGLSYNGLKRPDKMVNHFEKFLKMAPNAPEADKVKSLLRSVR